MNLLLENLRARGHHLLRCSDSPDTSGINAAAVANAGIGQEALDFYKQQYADQAPVRDAATNLSLEQAQLQNAASKKQIAAADDSLAYQKDTFRPVEEKLASDAMNYDTPARREAAAAAATSDVERSVSAQRDASTRALERTGALPSSGRALALQGSMDLGAAKLKAGAANTARQQVEAQGTARLGDVANLGRGIASGQVAQLQSGVQAGNSAVGNATTANAVNTSGNGTMQQGFSTALQGNSSAGSLYGTKANIEENSNNGLLGGLAGLGMAAGSLGYKPFSDKNLKTDRKPVDGEVALASVRRMPVEKWRYKSDSKADDGGQQHVGPMAQDVHAAAGESAAPGGDHIDLISMNGITLAAVQQLDKGQRKLEKKIVALANAASSKKRVSARRG